jgi:hypothetical protein
LPADDVGNSDDAFVTMVGPVDRSHGRMHGRDAVEALTPFGDVPADAK